MNLIQQIALANDCLRMKQVYHLQMQFFIGLMILMSLNIQRSKIGE